MTEDPFDWPCERRDAHAPHEVVEQTAPQDWDRWPCPGVPAHPLTMAGGAHRACTCPYTDPSTWLSAASLGYGSGYEPGSMQEWDPDCPVHHR